MYSGTSQLKQELANLNELIHEVEKLLGAAVSKKTRLRYDLAPEPLFILGDRSQIQQVAMNLITNASEAMDEKGSTVTVRTAAEEVEEVDRASLFGADVEPISQLRRYHVLEVTDEGPGMDNETQDRILEPFFSTKFPGRGLGLATVSGIVRSHHRMLKVDSSPGRGASFRAYFPAAEKPSPPSEPSRADRIEWRGEGTVLLADDEDAVRELLEAHLRHLGFEVIKARNGREALALYRQHRHQLVAVLMDQTMPEMEGVEAAKEMQRIGGDVPIVMLSGYAREAVVGGASANGIADFIQKPFSYEDLRRTLHDLLR